MSLKVFLDFSDHFRHLILSDNISHPDEVNKRSFYLIRKHKYQVLLHQTHPLSEALETVTRQYIHSAYVPTARISYHQ